MTCAERLAAVLSVSLLAACAPTAPDDVVGGGVPKLEPSERGDLLRHEKAATLTGEQIAANVSEYDLAELVRYDVDVYRVYYSSVYKGTPEVLSGLVMVPRAAGPLSHYQYHHGTMLPFPSSDGEGSLDAPSLYDGSGPKDDANQLETRFLVAVPASHGYFVSAPDYVGYNITSDLEHTYAYHPELAAVSVDMILAAQTLAEQLDVTLNDRLFLAGWSEGGGATLATHKLITEEHSDRLEVTASAPFAGPYHMSRFYREIMTAEGELDSLAIYNWAVYSANTLSGLNIPAEEIWRYPVAGALDALSVPSQRPTEVYQRGFLDGFAEGVEGDFLAMVAERQDLHEGWTPRGKVFLHSGEQDDIVPYYNSVDTYTALLAADADVVLRTYAGDHYSPAESYFRTMMSDFEELLGPPP